MVPGEFAYHMAYDTPFVFLGMGSFCWEVQISATTNPTGGLYHDTVSNATNANPALVVATFGSGCVASGHTMPMDAAGGSAMNWPGGTGTLTVTGSEGPANGPVIMTLGFSSTSWGGVPLPLPVPGSGGASSGLCNVYNDVFISLAAIATAAGTSSFSIPLFPNPTWNGLRTFEQLWALDPANPFGLVTSNGVNHDFVGPYGPANGARVFLLGSLGPTGTAGSNHAVIVRFDL